jgi:hypothetical protein
MILKKNWQSKKLTFDFNMVKRSVHKGCSWWYLDKNKLQAAGQGSGANCDQIRNLLT